MGNGDDRERRNDGLAASISGLRGKQSVRATFRLTSGAIEAISIVSTQLGIKQKSLFDHLMEDTQTLSKIAEEIRQSDFKMRNRVQKTYVVSRRTLSLLEQMSKTFGAPRDSLVEISIQRLLPIIRRERERHRKRKALFGKIARHFEEGEKILAESKALLGEDDPIYGRLRSVMAGYKNACGSMGSFIERGDIIEAFDIDDFDAESEEEAFVP